MPQLWHAAGEEARGQVAGLATPDSLARRAHDDGR